MNPLNRYIRPEFLTLLFEIVTALGACVPAQTVTRPTLDEVRLGNGNSVSSIFGRVMAAILPFRSPITPALRMSTASAHCVEGIPYAWKANS
jgi:hypothetical protein